MIQRTTHILLGAILLGLMSGCTLFKVHPPEGPTINLPKAPGCGVVDFCIETFDQIDRDHPIGSVGDTFWGGQYQVVLTDSLDEYFESAVAYDLQNAGYRVFRYPGEFAWQRMTCDRPPLKLTLELQDLSISRNPKEELLSDFIIGTCKIRAIVSDQENAIIYNRQFVGKIDTYRPKDELMLPGLGLISRAGLSATLTALLRDTVNTFRRVGIPQIRVVYDEYHKTKGSVSKKPKGEPKPDTPTTTPEKPKVPDEEEFSF
jgi:hypothetical protein